MFGKTLGLLTAAVAALAVVGVAWASSDDTTSTSLTLASSSTSSSLEDSSPSTGATSPSSTPATVDDQGGDDDDEDDDDDDRREDATTSTTTSSTTSTSSDQGDVPSVANGVTTYDLSQVGSVTIEVSEGRLNLVRVSAPGWDIARQRVEADRIELELTSGDDEASFEARIHEGRIEVESELDSS